MNKDNVEKLYQQLKEFLSGEKITSQKLIILTPRLLKAIQEIGILQKLSGQEKKQLFLDIVKRLIKDNIESFTKEEKEALDEFINYSLPLIVDAAVFCYKSEAFTQMKVKAQKCCKN